MSATLTVKKGFSLIWPDWDAVSRLLPCIATAGFHGIEPTFSQNAVPSPEDYRESAKELKTRCDDLGVAIPSMRAGRTPWHTIPSADPQQRQAAVDHTRRAFECLGLLGGSVLLVVPGQIDPAISYTDHWKRVVEYAVSVAEIAAEFDMTVGFENVEARFPLSLRDWRDLLAEIDHPRIRMYLDVGNITWLGLGFPEQWIELLAPWFCQLHFKDASFGGVLRNLLAGEVDWQAVVDALRAVRYSGWISVEPEWYHHAPHRLAERLSRDLDAVLEL